MRIIWENKILCGEKDKQRKRDFPFEKTFVVSDLFNPVGLNEGWKLLYCSKLTRLLCPPGADRISELVSPGHSGLSIPGASGEERRWGEEEEEEGILIDIKSDRIGRVH